MRITMHSNISSEERRLRDLNQEKDKVIGQKSVKLNSYADKERMLHDREYDNKELKKALDAQK